MTPAHTHIQLSYGRGPAVCPDSPPQQTLSTGERRREFLVTQTTGGEYQFPRGLELISLVFRGEKQSETVGDWGEDSPGKS